MLVMMTPSPASSERTRVKYSFIFQQFKITFPLQKDPHLVRIQQDLQLLLYRYLCFQDETKTDSSNSKELAISLMGLSEVSQKFLLNF